MMHEEQHRVEDWIINFFDCFVSYAYMMGWSTWFLQAKNLFNKYVNASGFSLGCLGLDSPKFFDCFFFMICRPTLHHTCLVVVQ